MSNKKYRQPAGESGQNSEVHSDAVELIFQQLNRESDPPPQTPDGDPMPDQLARRMLANMAMLMNHIGNLCGQAIDYASPKMADATYKQDLEREAAERAQGKERVRKAEHPLASMMRLAARAASLMREMLKATNPGMFNLVPGDIVEAKVKKAFDEAGKLVEDKLGTAAAGGNGSPAG